MLPGVCILLKNVVGASWFGGMAQKASAEHFDGRRSTAGYHGSQVSDAFIAVDIVGLIDGRVVATTEHRLDAIAT
jgi:hypothetical protein